MDPTGVGVAAEVGPGVGVAAEVESGLYNNVQAVLRELDALSPAGLSSSKGMLRWTLHKKVDRHPSHGAVLVRVLVKELEKVDRTDCKHHVIPLLHTLSYVLLQSGHIPASLTQRLYACCCRLLTLPTPYSSVALGYLRGLRAEIWTPGALYLKRVLAEQNLRTEHFPHQERVFVFADAAVFRGPLGASVQADLQTPRAPGGPRALERRVLLHTLQAGLGGACHGPRLAAALEVLGEDVLLFFQEMVLAVEQSVARGEGSAGQYQTRLHTLYQNILTSAHTEPQAPGHVSSAPLPSPDISFHLWSKEEELWNVLANFALSTAPAEEERREKRESVQSCDSGIERDLPEPGEGGGEREEREERPAFTRAPCVSRGLKSRDRLALVRGSVAGGVGMPLAREGRSHTARLVVMGDDRVLGRLAKAWLAIRKRESKHLLLTRKLDLQIYYVPVTDSASDSASSPTAPPTADGRPPAPEDRLSLARYLGGVDPWYHGNINSLGTMIHKLAESNHSRSPEPDVFLLDVLSYYLRCAVQPVHLPLYSVKMYQSDQASPVEDVFISHLQASFPELTKLREMLQDHGGSFRRKKSQVKLCGVVVSVNYRQVCLSQREVMKGMSSMACEVLVSVVPPNQTEGVDRLSVRLAGLGPRPPTEIRCQSVSVRTIEERTFTVCLDRDARRTYTRVQSVVICPCLDPGYSVQSPATSKLTAGGEKQGEAGLSQYMSKVLPLPINTFTGVTH